MNGKWKHNTIRFCIQVLTINSSLLRFCQTYHDCCNPSFYLSYWHHRIIVPHTSEKYSSIALKTIDSKSSAFDTRNISPFPSFGSKLKCSSLIYLHFFAQPPGHSKFGCTQLQQILACSLSWYVQHLLSSNFSKQSALPSIYLVTLSLRFHTIPGIWYKK